MQHRVFRTENTVCEGDYEDEGLDMDALTQIGPVEGSIRRGKVCLGKCITASGCPCISDHLAYDYVICKDFAGAQHFIRHTIKVLETRLRFKLLTLL